MRELGCSKKILRRAQYYSAGETRVDKAQVDRGWRVFWRNRGASKPPFVSGEVLGRFKLPGG